ncbi:MAG: T9SS type A sorting domain-containing protein [Bacteroidetes bacterium]|nr:T9SS type A sorting domain-containing protein [Bacteroidota bacterium]
MKAILIILIACGITFGQSVTRVTLNASSMSPVTFGGTDNDWVRCIMPTTNGDYILGGESVTGPPNYQLMAATARVSAKTGDTLWTNIWGRPLIESVEHQTAYNAQSHSVFQASYYEYAVGVDSVVSYLVRLDGNTGRTIWKRSFPNNFYAVAPYDSGCIIMNTGGNATAQIVNAQGNVVGQFPVTSYAAGYLKLVVQADTLWVFTTNFAAAFGLPDGKQYWTTDIPGTRLVITRGAVDPNGNAYVCFSDAYDLQLGYVKYGCLKLNSSGDILWKNHWFGWPDTSMARNLNNWVNAITVSAPLHVVVVMGTTNSIEAQTNTSAQSGYVAILNSDSGDTLWTEKWDYPTGNQYEGSMTNIQDGFFDNNGTLITAGYTSVGPSNMVSFIKKYEFNITPVNEPKPVPTSFALSQNYPNPFNPTTTISYDLPTRTNVTLMVYNVLGQMVATLVNGEQTAGEHRATFDGSRFASGTYFYVLQAGSFRSVQKMMLVK